MILELVGYITSRDDQLLNEADNLLKRLDTMLDGWQRYAVKHKDWQADAEAAHMRRHVHDLQEALARDEEQGAVEETRT